ncbi:MAG: O-antigen ligase family protein [Nitrospirae bacterium]|nr:O-antigen ligase family protein [Nitrospirota bacterium]MCL5977091.1 O-antigen ligase family protein [Nitrospirota bacterium]
MFHKLLNKYAWDAPQSIKRDINYVIFLLFAGYLWILPIAHTTTIRESLFFSLLFTTLWAAWRKGLKLTLPLLTAWLIYGAVAGVSLFYALDPVYSLKEIKNEIFYSMLVMLIAASWVRNEKALSKVIGLLIAGNVFLVCIGIIQVIHLQLSSPEKIVTAPLGIGVGKFSTYIILVIPVIIAQAVLSLKRNSFAAFSMFLLLCANLISLYFTINRAAWQSLVIEFVLIFFLLWYCRVLLFSPKILIGIGVILSLLAIFFSFSSVIQRSAHIKNPNISISGKVYQSLSDDPRLDYWGAAIKNIAERPLSGGGFGRETFKMLNEVFYKTKSHGWHAHNMFLNKGVQMGIPGIVAFCVLLGAALRKMWLIMKNGSANGASVIYAVAGIAMIAGMIIKNLTDDFFIRDLGWLFWLVTAAIIGAFRRGEQSRQ